MTPQSTTFGEAGIEDVPGDTVDDGDVSALEARTRALEEALQQQHEAYQSRLLIAGLRTEAIKAGMIDLDGLKLVDHKTLALSDDDQIVGGRKFMEELRRRKPWLFFPPSSSSTAIAPAKEPVRHRSALEMTEDEYASARAEIIKHHI